MSFEIWLAFTAATIVLLLIPGPTVLLVVSYALGQGWRTALPMAVGVALGDFTAMTLSLARRRRAACRVGGGVHGAEVGRRGLSRLARDQTLARRRHARGRAATHGASAARMLGHAWLVTALNPKGITFFVAFLPQFLNPHADFFTQMAVLEATFLTLAFANALGYALVASRARGFIKSPRAIRVVNRIGGSCLIGAGVAAVSIRATQ